VAGAPVGVIPRSALAALAVFLGSCGLVHKVVTIEQPFTVGGGAPSDASIDSSKILAPLSASAGDLSHLSSVTLQGARLETTDAGDLSFVSGMTIVISGNAGLPAATLATLPGPPSGTRVELAVDSSKDLKPYLAAGAVLAAHLTYAARPVNARGLKLTLTVRGSL
jgi:hypothetical protein